MYVKITNGTPENYTIGQFRKDNNQISFPKNISKETLESYGIYEVVETTRPNTNEFEIVDSSIENLDGVWTRIYTVSQIPLEDAEARVRRTRNRLLLESDWTQVADAPVDKTVWATYRQELRDITAQEGFPYNVVYPTEPM